MSSSADETPGPLIGAGRAADIYDLGGGRVLRRNRAGASTVREAEVMRHVRSHGYPAPEVFDADGGDLVMERLDGPTMLQAFSSRPWGLRGWARMLADLHLRLENIPLPDFALPILERGEVIVHGDLHPDNVILTDGGPVVIDWPNAMLAARGHDAAHTWVLVATADVEGGPVAAAAQKWGRGAFVRRFVDLCDRERLRPHLAAAAEHKLADRNVRPHEADAIRALVREQA
jgi:aminoglycoside phosphotransferase (APT) family kinase protein